MEFKNLQTELEDAKYNLEFYLQGIDTLRMKLSTIEKMLNDMNHIRESLIFPAADLDDLIELDKRHSELLRERRQVKNELMLYEEMKVKIKNILSDLGMVLQSTTEIKQSKYYIRTPEGERWFNTFKTSIKEDYHFVELKQREEQAAKATPSKRKEDISNVTPIALATPDFSPKKLKVSRHKKSKKWVLHDVITNQKLGEHVKLRTLLEIAKTIGVIVHCPDDIKKNVEEMTRLA